MNKKLLSLALCVVMLASVLPLEAFAADIVTDPAPSAEAPAPVCTCETACAPAAPNAACPVCSAADASETVCAKYVAPAPVAPLSAPGGDEETSPSPTVTPTPEPTPAATPTPTPTPEPDPTTEPDPDRAARIAAVQALIDALPTPDAFSALPEAELEAATAQVSAAVDAYDALSSDEQAEVNAEALFALFALPEDPAEELEGETAQNFLVGENGYADINSAIDAVTDGGTIKVNADNLSFTINTGKTFTLDINGKTSTEVTVSGGTVTVTGSNTVDDITGKKFTVKHLVVSGGTVNFYSGIINSVDVSSGELNISGGYILNVDGDKSFGTSNGNGVLTLTGGTATITGGSVAYVNLGLETKGDGTLNIKTATSADYMANVVGTLHYYGGTLNIDAKYNSNSAFAIYELDVLKSGLKLSNGKFNKIYISSSVSGLTPLDLLAPGWAYSNEYGIVDASDNLSGNGPYLITSHTTCTYNADTDKCACGRSNFVAVVEYGDTNIAYPYSTGASQSDLAGILNTAFTEAATHTGCTVKLMTDVAYSSEVGDEEYTISSGTFTLDLNGHDLTFNSSSFNVFGDITLTDSTTGETKGKLNTNGINVTGKLTLSGAEIVISGTSNKLKVTDGGALTVNSGTIKGDVDVTDTGSTLTVSGGKFDKSDDSNGFVSALDGTKVKISGGTFSDNTQLQIFSSEVELSGGKFGCISIARQGTTNTLPGILKANYEYKYYDGKGQVGTWTNGANLTSKSISRVEVKSIPIGSITITPKKSDLTYGESFTLNVVVKDTNGKDVNVDNDKYNWYVDTLNGPLSIEQKDRNSAAFTPDAICRQAGERTYRYEATVDGYTKSAEIKLTIKKAELTDEQKSRINPPIPQTLTYNPDISGGAYTGEGVSQNLFGVGNVTGLPVDGKYQYSFDGGKTWSENMSRSDAGTYDVLWRVNSPNYENYAPTNNKITGNIAPRPVFVASVTGITDINKHYDGTPDLPQQSSTPAVNVSYTYFDTGDCEYVTKTFALRPADYALKLEYAKESGGNYSPDSAVGTDKPILATLTLKNSNFVFDDNTKSATSNTVSKPQVVKDGQNNLTGEIIAATLTITAVNKTAYVGDPVPSLANPVQGEDFIVTGLAKGDTLESLGIKVKLVYVDEDGDPVTPDMTKPGTYKINPEVTLTTQLSNYGLPNCEKGTLTIEEAPEYTITASAGLNGSISPSGAVKVKKHQSQTFVITPNTGYVVANVKVDGVNLGSIRTYTFTDVTEEGHTIEATFMRPWGNPQTGVDIG